MYTEGVWAGVLGREVLGRGRELMNVLGRQRFPPHPQLLGLTIFKSFLGMLPFRKNKKLRVQQMSVFE